MKPMVVVTEGLEAGPLAWLRDHADVVEVKWTERPPLEAALRQAQGLIVRTYTQVNAALLTAAPQLRVVGRAGVGLENIDRKACEARGVKVLNTPAANTRAVCEYVFNLLFHLGRPLVTLRGPTPPAEFHAYRKTIRGLELAGKTMAILGMGRIGRSVGRIAWAMDMRVIYNDLVDVRHELDYPAESVSKAELYERADILTIHVDARPENKHLVDGPVLAKLRSSAIVVNTSRGEVLDPFALAAALKTQRIAGAALDVHEPEPPPPEYPLWGCPNVILAPHLAARTQGAMDAMSWVARDVVEYLNAQ